MTSEGTTEVPDTSPLVDLEALEKLRSQPIPTDVDGLREEIAAFKETYPVEEYDTFWGPRGPYNVPAMLNFNRTKRSTVYKAMEMLALRNEALALVLEKKRVADAVANHASEHDLEKFDCPICLDTVIKISDDSIVYFSCCGNGLCATCADDWKTKGKTPLASLCPLCRARKSQAPNSLYTAPSKYCGKKPCQKQRLKPTSCMDGLPHEVSLGVSSHEARSFCTKVDPTSRYRIMLTKMRA